MKNQLSAFLIGMVAVTAVVAVGGCKDSAVSRDVSETEVQESNTRRAEAIDELNIPEEQKARMKERLGQPSGESGR